LIFKAAFGSGHRVHGPSRGRMPQRQAQPDPVADGCAGLLAKVEPEPAGRRPLAGDRRMDPPSSNCRGTSCQAVDMGTPEWEIVAPVRPLANRSRTRRRRGRPEGRRSETQLLAVAATGEEAEGRDRRG